MARPRRILYNGALYHVMARANGRRRLFVDDFDRLRFFELLGKVQQRYITWNPVESGYVKHPNDWVWSSHRAMAGLAAPPEFLDLSWLQAAFGGRTLAEAQLEYRKAMDDPLPVAEVEQYLNTIVVGSEGFQEAVRKQIGITMYDLIIPRSYRALARPSLGQLFAGIDDLDDRDRTIRRAQVVYGYRQSEIARTLNLHPNTVSKIVSTLKKQRFFLVRVG